MAKHGLFMTDIMQADFNEALRRAAKATAAIDGGQLVSVSAFANGICTVAKATSLATGGLWLAENPTEHFMEIEGLELAGVLDDERYYANCANRPFMIRKPMVNDVFSLSEDHFKTVPTAGQYIDWDSTNLCYKGVAAGSKPSGVQLKVVEIDEKQTPNAGKIGGDVFKYVRVIVEAI